MSILKIGSSGDETRDLQQKLKDNGYDIDVDGIYGSQTANAVKKYQSNNGLASDGVVGDNTWAALNSATSNTTNTTQNIPDAAITGTTADTVTPNTGYTKSSDVLAKEKAAEEAQTKYQDDKYTSQWDDEINKTIDSIINQGDFSYDVNSDIMYNQYKDQYTQNGKLAMMDSMAENAALTGGYGSSYGQSVGQQTYNNYMQQLNNKIPELEQLALDRYNAERDNLIENLGIYSDQDNTDYSRWTDSDNKLGTISEMLNNEADTEYANDFNQYTDNRDYTEGVREYDTTYNENQRQFNENFAEQQKVDNANIANDNATLALNTAAANTAKSTSDIIKDLPDGVTASLTSFQDDSDNLYKYLNNLVGTGLIDLNTADALYSIYGGTDTSTDSTKYTTYEEAVAAGVPSNTMTKEQWVAAGNSEDDYNDYLTKQLSKKSAFDISSAGK